MPYPESCPECGSAFRNTGTHFTARRNEVGRHVLLELGCQTTSRRFWWDFTSGGVTEEGQPRSPRRSSVLAAAVAAATSATNGSYSAETNGHAALATLEMLDVNEDPPAPKLDGHAEDALEPAPDLTAAPPPVVSPSLRDAFVRQLQLDRLTLRQMRSWLTSK
jgi:hypothetical protein